jgi:lipopolysaccharide export system permease protein
LRDLSDVIFWKILGATVYSTVSLTFCAWVVQSSRYLWVLNSNSIGFSKFLKFTSYLSVDIISVILPIALAVSSAFVYQRFVESGQLIALQAAGLSPKRVLTPLLKLSAVIICCLYTGNAYISPYAWREFRSLEFKIKNNIDPPEKAGIFFSRDGFSVYAQKYNGDFSFGNLFIVDARNSDKTYTYFAKEGAIRDNILILTEGERIEIDFTDHSDSVMHFRSYSYDLREILKAEKKTTQPNEKFLDELYNSVESVAERALFHQKITSPLLAVIFPLFSFLLILTAPYSRKPSYRRMFFLILLITAFQGSYFWIANAAAKNLAFIRLNYILIGFSAILSVILIAMKRRV